MEGSLNQSEVQSPSAQAKIGAVCYLNLPFGIMSALRCKAIGVALRLGEGVHLESLCVALRLGEGVHL